MEKINIKKLRTIIIFSSLFILVITLILEYYIPTILTFDAFTIFNTSAITKLIRLIIDALQTFCFAAIISVFISYAIESSFQKKETQMEIVNNNDVPIPINYYPIEPEIEELLVEELYMAKTIRRNMSVHIIFTINNDRTVTEKMTWRHDIINRTDEDIEYRTVISTTDRNNRVVPDKSVYIDLSDEKMVEREIIKKPESLISSHKFDIPIKSKSGVTSINNYTLNLGIKDQFYQNAIGVKEFVIGLNIDIQKPKGYIFTIELFSKNHLIPSDTFCNSGKTNVNETNLHFQYNKALFPGTGIEYSLEKAVSD